MKASNRTIHFYLACLLLRITAFVFLVLYAVGAPARFSADLTSSSGRLTPLTAVWLLLMVSMVFRLFPSRSESLGCQKEFSCRFRPTGAAPSPEEIRRANRGALWVLAAWIGLNALFFFGHWKGWLTQQFMVCLAGFYGVCDIICILFFCHFQSWMMHNRCCTTCRIYNWDYLMICTPLLCLTGVLAASACILAVILFLRWEFTYIRRKERFFESSNEALRCSQCQEQLCRYKRKLASRSKH